VRSKLATLFFLLAIGAGLAIAGPTPGSAGTPCEEDPTCHPELKRECDDDPCGCFACDSEREICCLDEN